MPVYLNKEKLLEALRTDVLAAEPKRNDHDPNNPREAIIHHICKDEAIYAQTIVDAIKDGKYDVVI